jgi:hypothetical protein
MGALAVLVVARVAAWSGWSGWLRLLLHAGWIALVILAKPRLRGVLGFPPIFGHPRGVTRRSRCRCDPWPVKRRSPAGQGISSPVGLMRDGQLMV